MKIIIEIKDTATLSRIAELGKILTAINATHAEYISYVKSQTEFSDVIASIDREW